MFIYFIYVNYMSINFFFYYPFYYLWGGRRTNGGLNHCEATRTLMVMNAFKWNEIMRDDGRKVYIYLCLWMRNRKFPSIECTKINAF